MMFTKNISVIILWNKHFTGSIHRVYRYATASARRDGMFLLCGGRDASGTVWLISHDDISHSFVMILLLNHKMFPSPVTKMALNC